MADQEQNAMATASAGGGETGMPELAGKYLAFRLGSEEYGLEILKVREINGLMDITAVPRTPEYIRGVINLRGKVIPVVDLRAKFGMEVAKDTEHTCIIVVDISQGGTNNQMGILVDSVSEVLDIAGDDIEGAPSFGASVDTRFILGMAKAKGGVKILLDIGAVLGGDETLAVGEAAVEAGEAAASEPGGR